MEKLHQPSQDWDPDSYAANARFVSRLGSRILNKLSPCKGEDILDLGCGDGYLSKEIVNAGSKVVAIDSSSDFVEAAKKNGVDAYLINAHNLTYNKQFDAVFSNAALHWMLDPDSVIKGVSESLKPGGRFVAEFGGIGNVKKIIKSIQSEFANQGFQNFYNNPWYFPSIKEYKNKLEKHNFLIREIELFDRPTKLPSDVGKWLDVFADPFFVNIDHQSKVKMKNNIIEDLSKEIRDESGVWWADYVRLSFAADHF